MNRPTQNNVHALDSQPNEYRPLRHFVTNIITIAKGSVHKTSLWEIREQKHKSPLPGWYSWQNNCFIKMVQYVLQSSFKLLPVHSSPLSRVCITGPKHFFQTLPHASSWNYITSPRLWTSLAWRHSSAFSMSAVSLSSLVASPHHGLSFAPY